MLLAIDQTLKNRTMTRTAAVVMMNELMTDDAVVPEDCSWAANAMPQLIPNAERMANVFFIEIVDFIGFCVKEFCVLA